MGIKKIFTFLAVFTALVLSFQNCSPYNNETSFSQAPSESKNTVDSGTPYEGKMYAILGPMCADGTEIHSRIILSSSSEARMNRDQCRDITPVTLAATEFHIDSVTDTLIYKNQDFKSMGVTGVGITNLSYSNDATQFYYGYTFEGDPSWLQVFLDTDNDPTTGFSRNGIGAEYMIENDNVWVYSAAVGAPQDTWAWNSLVSANKNKVGQSISWSFARSAIGSPALIKFVAQTSLGAKSSVVTQTPQ